MESIKLNIQEKIKSYTNHGIKTLLGVGPMSNNIIDVTIELADKFNVPLMLIASRRQIDSEHHGGGYVNNWTTENFQNTFMIKISQKVLF